MFNVNPQNSVKMACFMMIHLGVFVILVCKGIKFLRAVQQYAVNCIVIIVLWGNGLARRPQN